MQAPKKVKYVDSFDNPDYQAYSDSLNTYKAYQYQKRYQNDDKNKHIAEVTKALKEYRANPNANITMSDGNSIKDYIAFAKRNGQTPEEYLNWEHSYEEQNRWDENSVPITEFHEKNPDYWNWKKSVEDEKYSTKPGDEDYFDKSESTYYDTLKFFKPVSYTKGVGSSDLVHKEIKPVNTYWDGNAISPVYKKPEVSVFVEGSPKAEIAKKQEQLKEAGLYKGEIDGIWGSKSQAAWDKLNPPKEEPETTNFEKRIMNPEKSIDNQDGTSSTHKMMSFEANGKFYAAPTVVEIDGELRELSPREAVDYAMKNKEYKEFESEADAQNYAEGGYKKGTPLEQATPKGEYIKRVNNNYGPANLFHIDSTGRSTPITDSLLRSKFKELDVKDTEYKRYPGGKGKGKSPIKYVTSADDPAYKAYSDSLDVYNRQNLFNQQYLQNFEQGEVEPFVPEDDPSFFQKLNDAGQDAVDLSMAMYENSWGDNKDIYVVEYPDRKFINDKLIDKKDYEKYDTKVDKGHIVLREGHKIKNSEANEKNFADAILGDDTEDIFEEKVVHKDHGFDLVATGHESTSEGGYFDDYDTYTKYKYSYPHKEVYHPTIKPAGYHEYHEAHSPNRDADPSSISYDANNSFDVDLPYYVKPKMKVEVRPEPEVEFEKPTPLKPGKLPFVPSLEVIGDSPFEKFRKTLPPNLRYTNPNDYDLEGYWDALGRPEEFDYENEPKDPEEGSYHAFSRHPRTGQLLKSENHPSFKEGLEADVEMGYLPYRNKKTGKIHTFDTPPNPNEFEPYGDYHKKAEEKKEKKIPKEGYVKKVVGAPGVAQLWYIDSAGKKRAINDALLRTQYAHLADSMEVVNYYKDKDMKKKQTKKKYFGGLANIASGLKAAGQGAKYAGAGMTKGLGALGGVANFANDAVNLYAGITGDEKAAQIGKITNAAASITGDAKQMGQDKELNQFMTDYEKGMADKAEQRAAKRSVPSFRKGKGTKKYPGGKNYKPERTKKVLMNETKKVKPAGELKRKSVKIDGPMFEIARDFKKKYKMGRKKSC